METPFQRRRQTKIIYLQHLKNIYKRVDGLTIQPKQGKGYG